jgi:hypothetical protein
VHFRYIFISSKNLIRQPQVFNLVVPAKKITLLVQSSSSKHFPDPIIGWSRGDYEIFIIKTYQTDCENLAQSIYCITSLATMFDPNAAKNDKAAKTQKKKVLSQLKDWCTTIVPIELREGGILSEITY